MNHYETLGVKPDATPEDVKRAYRKRSSENHPDKNHGDNTEAMAAINRAYEVLSDTERRQRYDATGKDEKTTSIEEHARLALVELFSAAIESATDHFLVFAQDRLNESLEGVDADIARANRKIKKLEKSRNCVKAKSGENLFHALVDKQITDLKNRVSSLDRAGQIMRAVKVLLEDYESTGESPKSETASYIFERAFASRRTSSIFGAMRY